MFHGILSLTTQGTVEIRRANETECYDGQCQLDPAVSEEHSGWVGKECRDGGQPEPAGYTIMTVNANEGESNQSFQRLQLRHPRPNSISFWIRLEGDILHPSVLRPA